MLSKMARPSSTAETIDAKLSSVRLIAAASLAAVKPSVLEWRAPTTSGIGSVCQAVTDASGRDSRINLVARPGHCSGVPARHSPADRSIL